MRIDLQVTGGGGIVALRSLDGAIETQGAQKSISSDLVAREIRITLGQLPGTPGRRPRQNQELSARARWRANWSTRFRRAWRPWA